MSPEIAPARLVQLAWPFGALAALAAVETALGGTARSWTVTDGAGVLAATALLAGFGAFLTPRTHGRNGWTLLLVVPPVAGVLFALVGAIALERRSLVGILATWAPMALIGVAAGLFLLLPLVFVFHAARQVGRARSDSVVDLSDRRRVWMAVVTTVTLFVLVLSFPPGPPRPFWLAAFAALPLVLAIVDLLAWNDVRAERARHGAALSLGRGREGENGVDLGVGEERWVLASAPLAYRDPGARQVFAHGDFAETARRLLVSAAWGVGCTVLLGVTWWLVLPRAAGR